MSSRPKMTTICPVPHNLEWHREELRKAAEEVGLLDAAMATFEDAISNGKTPCEALEIALWEWDIEGLKTALSE